MASEAILKATQSPEDTQRLVDLIKRTIQINQEQEVLDFRKKQIHSELKHLNIKVAEFNTLVNYMQNPEILDNDRVIQEAACDCLLPYFEENLL